jgi:hypothetical protein
MNTPDSQKSKQTADIIARQEFVQIGSGSRQIAKSEADWLQQHDLSTACQAGDIVTRRITAVGVCC